MVIVLVVISKFVCLGLDCGIKLKWLKLNLELMRVVNLIK